MSGLIVRSLGQQPYLETWEAMKSFTADRSDSTNDELWCLEHPRVYTQGQAGKAEHILAPGDIPVIPVDRGGQVTYHGPGQLVVYLMINLSRRKMGVRALVDVIEQSLVRTLAELGITAEPRPDAPGVYVGDAKIASLGLRVRRGCSFHGLALNVHMDMEPFRRINPCGYAGLAMCQVSDFVATAPIDDIEKRLAAQLVVGLGDIAVSYREGWGN
ncbi:MAG: lipoyl(octanoyl) transferase LipB [Marinobacter sp.]|mgnify:FL=1|uniref:lipoyl(octanoyl) transferase LipB n=1 Tax=Marinobacter sp. TaxID=50741 RepID=UPI001B4A47E9|nr:lipoyl(octanoyl) transferase LipB [Marinobacter sp.]MBQ0748264.1 lipoyl(octanoyl) transferase LipB [Marinobacter sp.]MBQ0816202.1 lipoyl(octanoyl) transferase LipB [Marinobacter sp.]|tara:strand:+ start:21983 stop:22627 length:645 start_codon:yes stop_codon:yes gene_type:complete